MLRFLIVIFAALLRLVHPVTSEHAWLVSSAARCIEYHESTDGKYSSNLWQFEWSTFHSVTGLYSDPGSYPAAVQDHAAYELWRSQGWKHWSTRFVCGLG